MGFRILIDSKPNAGFAYVPGQRLYGRVIYHAERDGERLDDVSIIFQGKIVTQMKVGNGNSRTRETECIYLFRLAITLLKGRVVMAADTHREWPFDFLIPDGSNYRRERGSDTTFAPEGYCPLPPSFAYEATSWGHSGKAWVRYKLKLGVNQQKVFGSKTVNQPISITMTSPVPLAAPDVTTFSCGRGEWSSSSLRPESHNFKQKLQHVFTNDPTLKTPAVVFRAFLIMPSALGINQTAPLSISIVHERQGLNDPENPTLMLKSLIFEFESTTSLRVQRLWGRSHFDCSKELSASVPFHSLDPIRLPLNGEPVLLRDQMGLPISRNHMNLLMPDFKTYTVSYTHAIKANVIIEHFESGHEFKLKSTIPFGVFPPYLVPTGQGSTNGLQDHSDTDRLSTNMIAAAGAMPRLEDGEQEQLPPYQERDPLAVASHP